MKKYILVLIIVLTANFINAQDNIIKTDRTEIKVKVVEITEDNVKYKLWDRQSGPIYNINKSEIFMIIYKSGEKEFFKQKKETSTVIGSRKNSYNPNSYNTTNINNKIYDYKAPLKINFGFGNQNVGDSFGLSFPVPFLYSKVEQGSFEMELVPFLIFSKFEGNNVYSKTILYGSSLSFGYGYMVSKHFKVSGGVGYYYALGTSEVSNSLDESVSDISINDIYYHATIEYFISNKFSINLRHDEVLGFNFGIGIGN